MILGLDGVHGWCGRTRRGSSANAGGVALRSQWRSCPDNDLVQRRRSYSPVATPRLSATCSPHSAGNLRVGPTRQTCCALVSAVQQCIRRTLSGLIGLALRFESRSWRDAIRCPTFLLIATSDAFVRTRVLDYSLAQSIATRTSRYGSTCQGVCGARVVAGFRK